MIISVGYRVNSKTATNFRIWATKTLKQHIVSGYTVNRSRIAKNYDEFMATVAKLQAVSPDSAGVDPKTTLDLVRLFADTWFSLDAYDKETLAPAKVNKKKVKLTAQELQSSIAVLKEELIRKGKATCNFAQERNREALEGIVGMSCKVLVAMNCILMFNQRQRTYCTSLLKIIRLLMEINVPERMRLYGFCIKLKC